MIACAVVLVIVALAAGWLLGRQSAATQLEGGPSSALATPTATLAPLPAPPRLPKADVPGMELVGLPRYPGSVRVAYARTADENLVTTDAEYLTTAGHEYVRDFYREVFNSQGWTVVDARFSEGVWVFLAVNGPREVRVRIETRQSLTDIDIHLTEPVSGEPSPATPATPTGEDSGR